MAAMAGHVAPSRDQSEQAKDHGIEEVVFINA